VLELVDLSNNNPSPIDFAQLKRHGIFGAWLKVSEGLHFADPDWTARARAAREAGLRVGGYHFARPIMGSAVPEAKFFCACLGKVGRRDLHPVLDLETNPGRLSAGELHDWARHFLAAVHDRTGVKALTYSSPGFIGEQNWTATFGTGAGLWLAAYGPNDGREHPVETPPPWKRHVAHQYTSVGVVPGILGHVDLTHAKRRRPILAHSIRGLV